MNKKGFTLVELLATLLILGFLVAIIVPIVNGTIEKAKKQAATRSAENYVNEALLYFNENNTDYSNIINKLEINGTKASSGTIKVNKNGQVYMSLIINDYCFTKKYTDSISGIVLNNDVSACSAPASTPTDCFLTTTYDESNPAITFGVAGTYITKYLCGDTATEINNNIYSFNYSDDGQYTDVVIPSEIDGEPIVGIDEFAFCPISSSGAVDSHNKVGVKSVTIPEGIQVISVGAFAVNEINSVSLPDTLTNIGSSAFFENSLTSLTIPNGVTNIADNAFAGNNLGTISIGKGLVSLNDSAFYKGILPYDDSFSITSNPNLTNIYNNSSIPNSSSVWNEAISGSTTGDIGSVSITTP